MSTADAQEFSTGWLSLREHADAAARSRELLDPLRTALAHQPHVVVHDLGSGTGSLGRWLAARLSGPQHWILHDRDPVLLERAEATMARTAADGGPVTVETHRTDIADLRADDLSGSSLVAASALLDLLTAEEVDRLVTACVDADCPALLTLSVVGRVQLAPVDPLDADIAAAFNEHQRRTDQGRAGGADRLLGPDAVELTAQAFARRGASVRVAASPWRLGPDHAELTAEWLRGWVGAACEQRPQLAAEAPAYLRRRLEACEAGELHVVVGHSDLLATPGGAP